MSFENTYKWFTVFARDREVEKLKIDCKTFCCQSGKKKQTPTYRAVYLSRLCVWCEKGRYDKINSKMPFES